MTIYHKLQRLKSSYKKLCLGKLAACFSILMFSTVFLYSSASGEDSRQSAILYQGEQLSLQEQQIKRHSAGLYHQQPNLKFVGLYSLSEFQESLFHGFSQSYRSVDLLFDASGEKFEYLGIYRSETDHPSIAKLHTFQAATAIGYKISTTDTSKLTIGGGVAVGDFGVELSGGKSLPVIPVPLIRWNYQTSFLQSKIEFLTSPNWEITLCNSCDFSLAGDFRMDQLRDDRDLIYETRIDYKLFPATSELRNAIKLSIGMKNDSLGEYVLEAGDGEETFEFHYKAAFISLDASLLKIEAGYAFSGRELYRGEEKRGVGGGQFLSLSVAAPF